MADELYAYIDHTILRATIVHALAHDSGLYIACLTYRKGQFLGGVDLREPAGNDVKHVYHVTKGTMSD